MKTIVAAALILSAIGPGGNGPDASMHEEPTAQIRATVMAAKVQCLQDPEMIAITVEVTSVMTGKILFAGLQCAPKKSMPPETHAGGIMVAIPPVPTGIYNVSTCVSRRVANTGTHSFVGADSCANTEIHIPPD